MLKIIFKSKIQYVLGFCSRLYIKKIIARTFTGKQTDINTQKYYKTETNDAIIVGGWSSKELHQYSIKDQLWTKLENVELTDYCKAVFEFDENIYTVARNGNVTSLIENKTYKHPLNESSCIHTSKIGSKILIFNKIEPHIAYTSEIKMFDTKYFIWKDLKTKVVNRILFSAVEYMGLIWILGGRSNNGLQLESVDSVEIYDPILDLINPSPLKMLCSRYQHRSITYKGKLYVLGGLDGDTLLNSVEMKRLM